jgi:hypothetical protein
MKPLYCVVLLSSFSISSFLSACNLTRESFAYPGAHTVLVQPSSGAVYFLGQVVRLTVLTQFASCTRPCMGEASPPHPRLASFTYYANGEQIELEPRGPADLPGGLSTGDSESGEARWMPLTPGQYDLQGSAILNNGQHSTSDAVRICVLPANLNPTSLQNDPAFPVIPYGYAGPCPIPGAYQGPKTEVTLRATAAANLDYYRAIPGCNFGAQGLTIHAIIRDPGNRVAYVLVNLAVTSDRYTQYEALILTPTSAPEATGEGHAYDGTTADLGTYLDGGVSSLSIIWTAFAVGNAGTAVARDGPHTTQVALRPRETCVLNPPPAQTPPILLPPLPIETATNTPTIAPTPTSSVTPPPTLLFSPTKRSRKTPEGGGECSLSEKACLPLKFDSATCTCY